MKGVLQQRRSQNKFDLVAGHADSDLVQVFLFNAITLLNVDFMRFGENVATGRKQQAQLDQHNKNEILLHMVMILNCNRVYNSGQNSTRSD